MNFSSRNWFSSKSFLEMKLHLIDVHVKKIDRFSQYILKDFFGVRTCVENRKEFSLIDLKFVLVL